MFKPVLSKQCNFCLLKAQTIEIRDQRDLVVGGKKALPFNSATSTPSGQGFFFFPLKSN